MLPRHRKKRTSYSSADDRSSKPKRIRTPEPESDSDEDMELDSGYAADESVDLNELDTRTGKRLQREVSEPAPKRRKQIGFVVPSVATELFKEADLAKDDDPGFPAVNWWSASKRYPRTMGQLIELETSFGISSVQNGTWNKILDRPSRAELTTEMLAMELTHENLERSQYPRSKKASRGERLAIRIVNVAKKQLERRTVITNARNKKERYQQRLASNQYEDEESDQEEESEQDDDDETPRTPLTAEASFSMDGLKDMIWSEIRDGAGFPESKYDDPEELEGTTEENSDMILSRTPIDDSRVVFGKGYKKIKPIDFAMQIHMPRYVTASQMDSLVKDPDFKPLKPRWIGVAGNYRFIVQMKDAPHDAAYGVAHENQDKLIDEHSRQWFLTLNTNLKRSEILSKLNRNPDDLVHDVLALLESYDAELFRIGTTGSGEFPLPVGYVRRWKILFMGSEVAPTTRNFHIHLVISLTYIRFGPMQVRINYPKLTRSLQDICSVAYFHAICIKSNFADDPTANSRDEARLKGYIEKAQDYFTRGNSNQVAEDTRAEQNNKQLRR